MAKKDMEYQVVSFLNPIPDSATRKGNRFPHHVIAETKEKIHADLIAQYVMKSEDFMNGTITGVQVVKIKDAEGSTLKAKETPVENEKEEKELDILNLKVRGS